MIRNWAVGLAGVGLLCLGFACGSSDDGGAQGAAGAGGADAGSDAPKAGTGGGDSGTPDGLTPDTEGDGAAAPDAPGKDANTDTVDAKPAGECFPLVDPPALTVDNYPWVDGSTSTQPLDMVIACELLGVPWVWATNSDYTRFVTPDPKTPQQQVIAQHLLSDIVHNTTDPAFVNLINGTKDLIFVASKPSTDDLALAAAAGVTLEYKSIALDALIFLLNAQNPVDALTTNQILQIYQGTTTDWSAVGGTAGEIHPYVRPENSGSQELMKELVIKDTPMPPWPEAMKIATMFGLVDTIKDDALAIGYTVYYFWTYQYPSTGTKTIAVDGVEPTYDTIRARTYPYASDVYAIIRTDLAQDSLARKLRDWLLTPSGQCVIGKTGYVPLPQ